jgi:hypothetical protein
MMRTPPLLKLLCPALLVALCLFAQPAWSITIDAGDITDGANHVRDDTDGFDVYANGGTFITSSFNGWNGFFGVTHTGDAVEEEADVFGENIVITFDTPQVIDVIELGRLFAIGNFADEVNERVEIIAGRVGAGDLDGLLTVGSALGGGSDLYNGTWTGSLSTPTNISAADESGAGVWRIIAPFGEEAVTSLTFNPYQWPGIGDEGLGQNSDFALLSVVTTVPEPQTAILFGLGMAGLGILGRRRG